MSRMDTIERSTVYYYNNSIRLWTYKSYTTLQQHYKLSGFTRTEAISQLQIPDLGLPVVMFRAYLFLK